MDAAGSVYAQEMIDRPTWTDRWRAARIPLAVVLLTVAVFVVGSALEPPGLGDCYSRPPASVRERFGHQFLPIAVLYGLCIAVLTWLSASLRNDALGRQRRPGRLVAALTFLACVFWVGLVAWSFDFHLLKTALPDLAVVALIFLALGVAVFGYLTLLGVSLVLLLELLLPINRTLANFRRNTATLSTTFSWLILFSVVPLLILAAFHPGELGSCR